MLNDNEVIIKCMEAQTYYTAMSEKNRQAGNMAWMGKSIWFAKANVYSLLAEAFLDRAESLTKK